MRVRLRSILRTLRFCGKNALEHNLAHPDVSAEEDFHGGGEWNCEEGSYESAEDQRPKEHREDDGERVEADGIADDFRGGDEGIDLLNHHKYCDDTANIGDGAYAEGGRSLGVEVANDASGNEAEDAADVGDYAENGHEYADEKSVG